MNFYRRNLPHWQPPSARYFVTFRLVNSLPKEALLKIRNLKAQLVEQLPEESDEVYTEINRRLFHTYEKHLENKNSGPFWLRKQEVAELICDSIEYRNDDEYDLYAYCVMPNHVHLAFQLLTDENKEKPVTAILRSLKLYTASKGNEILNRNGQFWQHESFDRVIRDNQELVSTVKYILRNPVKAELVNKWQDWPYSFCKSQFKQDWL